MILLLCQTKIKMMALANAISWMEHQENHHTDLTITYNKLFFTHTLAA